MILLILSRKAEGEFLFKIACNGWPQASSDMTQPGPEPRYEVARKGTTLGTYALSEIAAEIASGKLAWTDDCWAEGMESWVKLADIKDQVDSLAAGGNVAKAPSRSLLYVGIGVISLLTVGAVTYLALSPDPVVGPADSPPPSPSGSPAGTRIRLDKPLSLKLSETQAKITVLVASSFDTVKEPAGLTTYSHRYYRGVGNRIPLRVQINADGRFNLQTFYQGKNWIFHNQLKFAFNQQTAETSVIPAYQCRRDISDDNSVTENCRFEATEDLKLVGRLAAAARTKVTMQMLGRNPVEKTLSHETKEALRESHELAELLKTRSKLLADLAITP
jgi:hypothetical protein